MAIGALVFVLVPALRTNQHGSFGSFFSGLIFRSFRRRRRGRSFRGFRSRALSLDRGFFRSRIGGCADGRFLLRSVLIVFAAIIGGVKARTFEDQSGARAEQTLDFPVAPFFQPTEFLRTFL